MPPLHQIDQGLQGRRRKQQQQQPQPQLHNRHDSYLLVRIALAATLLLSLLYLYGPVLVSFHCQLGERTAASINENLLSTCALTFP